MRNLRSQWSETLAPRLGLFWERQGSKLLALGIAIMVVAALGRAAVELPRLLQDTDGTGAIDLKSRYLEVQRWFAGLPVYGVVESADYPPATYVLLWPLLGWLAWTPARWLWMVTSVMLLGWLARVLVRSSGTTRRLERWFVVMVVLSASAPHVALGVGQLVNHVLPLLLTAALLLKWGRARWRDDLTTAGLLVFTLAKPTVSVPFFWVVTFVPQRLRPLLLVVVMYGALTLLASAFQEAGVATLVAAWRSQESHITLEEGYANLHKLLDAVGFDAWQLPATASVLVALGLWVYRRQNSDIWILLGVSGLVGRLSIHHRLYDDLMILPALIALFRLARSDRGTAGRRAAAGLLCAALWVSLIAPARFLGAPPPWDFAVDALHGATWLAALCFLMADPYPEDRARVGNPELQSLVLKPE